MPRRPSSLLDFGRMFARRFAEERCLQIASSLTFTTLLAIVPILTVAVALVAAFPVFRSVTEHVEAFLVKNMLPESVEAIVGYARRFAENAGRLTLVGLVFLLVTAMLVLNTIERAFNQIWRVPHPRPLVQRAFIYWALLTVGPVLIGASLSLTSWVVSLSLGLVQEVPYAGLMLLKVVPILLTALAFALLYATVPNRRVLVRDALCGGFLGALAFEAMKQGFATYVAHFPTYQLVYGAFAVVPIFLLWIYLSWLVVLSGAVVTAVMPEWRNRAAPAEPVPGGAFLDALQILRLLWEAHRAGEIATLARLHTALKLPLHQIEAILERMVEARWVGRVGSGWALTRDAAQVSVADVYRLFVFRPAAKLPARQTGDELERLALELAGRIESDLRLPIEELFERAAAPEPLAAPVRAQAR